MYTLYKALTYISSPALSLLLRHRTLKKKEISSRVHEKKAIINHPRPHQPLIWFHAASVGEVQSALIVIQHIAQLHPETTILVTTGTVTSAALIAPKLPPSAIHQFYPLDHPVWVNRFLTHWSPDLIIWLESELWPNMLSEIKKRSIPAVLLNAHMSEKSYNRWKIFPSIIRPMLSAFSITLCQTQKDKQRYDDLGASKTVITDNLKYSAKPLPIDKETLEDIKKAIKNRPVWLYASTHTPEERIACEIHKKLKSDFPDLLTIIVPRHPERRQAIKEDCDEISNLNICFRGDDKKLPTPQDDIYIADTLGELGLFYKLAPIACIGRSFSSDGGGGHNPIEAAQYQSAILHGPKVQNLQEIFDEMHEANAAVECKNTDDLYQKLSYLWKNPEHVQKLQDNAIAYADKKNGVIERVMKEIIPLLDEIATIEDEQKTNR